MHIPSATSRLLGRQRIPDDLGPIQHLADLTFNQPLNGETGGSKKSVRRPQLTVGDQVGGLRLLRRLDHSRSVDVWLAASTRVVTKSNSPPSPTRVVVKATWKGDAKALEAAEHEMALLQHLRHPYVVACYGIIEHEYYHCIVMEYMDGGDMFSFAVSPDLGPLCRFRLMYQLISAVAHLHSHNIAHRDLKPENAVVSQDGLELRLIDLGFAFHQTSRTQGGSSVVVPGTVASEIVKSSDPEQPCSNHPANFHPDNYAHLVGKDGSVGTQKGSSNLIRGICGTRAYLAPEVAMGEAYDPYAVDMWGIGAVLYTMVFQQRPFPLPASDPKMGRIPDMMLNVPVDSDLRAVLTGLLCPVHARLSMSALLQTAWWVKGCQRLGLSVTPILSLESAFQRHSSRETDELSTATGSGTDLVKGRPPLLAVESCDGMFSGLPPTMSTYSTSTTTGHLGLMTNPSFASLDAGCIPSTVSGLRTSNTNNNLSRIASAPPRPRPFTMLQYSSPRLEDGDITSTTINRASEDGTSSAGSTPNTRSRRLWGRSRQSAKTPVTIEMPGNAITEDVTGSSDSINRSPKSRKNRVVAAFRKLVKRSQRA